MENQILQWRSKPLTVINVPGGDNSVISLSPGTMKSLNFFRGDTVLVKGKRGKETVLLAFNDDTCKDGDAGINDVVRFNLRVEIGDSVTAFSYEKIDYAKRVAILPIADTIAGFNGALFETFLAPYFRERYRPITQGDLFKCSGAGRQAEFRVVEIDPSSPPHAILAQTTIIHCEGEPIPRDHVVTTDEVGYDDIGGYKRQLAQFRGLVELSLYHSQMFGNVKPPRGILITGHSGTGKSLLAKACFYETGACCFQIQASELISSHSPDNNAKMIFNEAKRQSPAVIFIDKLDELGPAHDGADDEKRRAISQLAVELDSISARYNVIVIAATSFPDSVPSVLRGFGRFEHEIKIDIPDSTERLEILKIHTKNMTLAEDVDIEAIADLSDGFVGSDLASLCSRATLQRMNESLAMSDLAGTIDDTVSSSFLIVSMDDFRHALDLLKPSVFQRHADSIPQISPGTLNMSGNRLSVVDYTIACICPMGLELAPVEGMLDEIHDALPVNRDHNAYTLGRIGVHNVVVAIMPETGNNAAATAATQLLNDFPSIRFGLLVGIGGGVPNSADVRLGDVVVSQPTDTFGGVVQYDLGRRLEHGSFYRTGMLCKPPSVLSANVRKLESQHRRLGNRIAGLISEMVQKYPKMRAAYSPPAEGDHLFPPSYTHRPGSGCDECDLKQVVLRPTRLDDETYIHYGTIGSANVVVRDAALRDELGQDMNILCVEMEAAGLMDSFPCLVIRGISDYADTHKNKRWQPYAAAVAAAYMKELLLIIPARQVAQTQSAIEYEP